MCHSKTHPKTMSTNYFIPRFQDQVYSMVRSNMCFPSIATVLGLPVNGVTNDANTDSRNTPSPEQIMSITSPKNQTLTSSASPVANAPTVSPSTEQKPFGFFNLPLELRRQIYEYNFHYKQLSGPRESSSEPTSRASAEVAKAKYKTVVHITTLQFVNRQLRKEYLSVWAEQHIHLFQLKLDFWRLIKEKDTPPADFAMATPWTARQMISAKTLAEALWTQLRGFLQDIESRYGVARRIRHIKIQTKITPTRKHSIDVQHPFHMVGQAPILKTLRYMQRLDDSLAHANLIVELVVSASNNRQSSNGHSVWWPSRRTAVFRQAHSSGAGEARLRSGQDWVLVSDIVEQRKFHAVPGGTRYNPAGNWEWELSGA